MRIPAYNKNKVFFTTGLLRWNMLDNERMMPWKNVKDPYKIWISEIILQQTRVQHGLEYYNRFIATFPTVQHIANAPQSQVFKLWEGLGYYSRCKNIIASATYITKELGGKFPDNYEDILMLKGVGNYTASAIASFAYNLPYPVLDGNVFRVLSRFFGIAIPIDNNDGKLFFSSLANELLDKENPAVYNQAIMDFGATVCKPKLPLCDICPVQQKCVALLNNMVNSLPVKEKMITRKQRWLYYILIKCGDKIFVRKRVTKDIWQNLYEFVLVETMKPVSIRQLRNVEQFKKIFNSTAFTITSVSKIYKQQLTHQTITGQFITVKFESDFYLDGYELVSGDEMALLPFPKFITAYLKD